MAFLSFDHGAAVYGATPVENMFLLEYLPTAPDDCLRVYLYARLLCVHPELGGSVSDVARALRLTDEAVEDAFRFWEREGLVKRLTDRPPTYALLPMRGAASASEMDQMCIRDRNRAIPSPCRTQSGSASMGRPTPSIRRRTARPLPK